MIGPLTCRSSTERHRAVWRLSNRRWCQRPKLAENVPKMCRSRRKWIKLVKLRRKVVWYALNTWNVEENDAYKVSLFWLFLVNMPQTCRKLVSRPKYFLGASKKSSEFFTGLPTHQGNSWKIFSGVFFLVGALHYENRPTFCKNVRHILSLHFLTHFNIVKMLVWAQQFSWRYQ